MIYRKKSDLEVSPIENCMGGQGTVKMENCFMGQRKCWERAGLMCAIP